MKLFISCINLLALFGIVVSICVLDTKKGWRLDCGLRDSYLLRIKDFGGFKANFDFGFGLGDEKGFPNSITKSNKAKLLNPYAKNHKKSQHKQSHHQKKPSYETIHHQKPSYETVHHQKPSYETVHHQKPSYETAHHQKPSYEKIRYQSPSYETSHRPTQSYESTHHQQPSYKTIHNQNSVYTQEAVPATYHTIQPQSSSYQPPVYTYGSTNQHGYPKPEDVITTSHSRQSQPFHSSGTGQSYATGTTHSVNRNNIYPSGTSYDVNRNDIYAPETSFDVNGRNGYMPGTSPDVNSNNIHSTGTSFEVIGNNIYPSGAALNGHNNHQYLNPEQIYSQNTHTDDFSSINPWQTPHPFQSSQPSSLPSTYAEPRRHDNSHHFSRRNEFPYQFQTLKQAEAPKKKKKRWPFSLFSWGKKEEEEEQQQHQQQQLQQQQYPRDMSIERQSNRRQFVQTPFIRTPQYQSQRQFMHQHQYRAQHPYSAQRQYAARPSASNYQRQYGANPYYNNLVQQQFNRQFTRTPSLHRNQRPFVFRSPNVQTTTPKIVTVGREMADLLKVQSNTEADSDNVPSFAAKMFVVREAPKEFFPPKYTFRGPSKKHISVQIPRTDFYCEEQSYLPGIYADTQLGCKMFHLCVPSAVGSTLTSYLCPNSTLFDQSILQCNYWYNVDCESSSFNFDANLALAKSYRKINAAHLDLHGATDTKSLSLLSQHNLSGSQATNRRGRLIEAEKTELDYRINSVLELIKTVELENNATIANNEIT